MALPDTVGGTLLPGYNPPHKSSGGNYYGLTHTSDIIKAYKSTAPGGGAWSNVGTGSEGSANSTLTVVSSISDGTHIHIVGIGSGFSLEYHRFDMSDDTWEVTNDQIADLSGMNTPSVLWCSIQHQPTTGRVVVVACGVPDTDMGTPYERVDYWYMADNTSAAWNGPNSIDAGDATTRETLPQIGPAADSENLHIAWRRDRTSPPIGVTLNAVTLDNAGTPTLSTIRVGSGFSPNATDGIGNPVSYDNSGTGQLWFTIYGGASAFGGNRATEDGSNDVGTLTSETVATSNIFSVHSAVFDSGGDLYIFRQSVDSDLYINKSTDYGNTWDSATEIEDAITLNEITVDQLDTDKFAYIYLDGTTTKYNEYSLAAAGGFPFIRRPMLVSILR